MSVELYWYIKKKKKNHRIYNLEALDILRNCLHRY